MIFPPQRTSRIPQQASDRPGLDRSISLVSVHASAQLTRVGLESQKVNHGPDSRRRILFMSSNGVGVGHLSRLLSIARRLPSEWEPVFFTMSQAMPIIHQFGFHSEYLPCFRTGQNDFDDWNEWLGLTLDQILEAYGIDSVVFDGNTLYDGLCDSISKRSGGTLTWIRRGMWREHHNKSNHLVRAHLAHLIIEPDDVASELDSGATASYRGEVSLVDPIRLLDPLELLDRTESCRKLGLDPDQRYALIQLGAGNNYNFIDLIDQLVETITTQSCVRPVIAQWITSDSTLDLWPQVPRICCFPISRYYRAFDYTISAVGYNSFNEIISFGVPSLLVPNLNRAMDDQAARAAFAEQHGAAIVLNSDTAARLGEMLEQLRDPERRRSLSDGCQAIVKPNGSSDAARIVCSLAEAEEPGDGH